MLLNIFIISVNVMGSNRGYARLMLNRENFKNVSWTVIKALPLSERVVHINSALSYATVRMPKRKAVWLAENFNRIEQMGGLSAAQKRLWALQGKSAKLRFFRQFRGIGEKYSRNIWMDLCDSDFRDSIAIDDRLKKICKSLQISTDNYLHAEQRLLEIAHEANLTGWELDRLLFHYNKHFLSAINAFNEKTKSDINEPNDEESIATIAVPTFTRPGVHITKHCRDKSSTFVFHEWKKIYQRFLRSRNTSNLGKKAKYVEELLREFSGRIPLAVIVDSPRRKELSIKLFNKTNDYNFIIYPLGMGLWTGALNLDGEYIVAIRHDL